MASVVATCVDGSPPPSTALLDGAFVDEFWIGDDVSERQLARVESMSFTPNGHLVVLDRNAYTVVVFDTAGSEIAAWGSQGEGPGEFANTPGELAVSTDGNIAIDTNSGRVDVFDIAGKLLESHGVAGSSATRVAFDGDGNVLVLASSVRLDASATSRSVARLADGEILWSTDPLPSVRATLQLYSPQPVMAGIGGGQIIVGMNNEYDLAVLDASTGDHMGSITRDVAMRGPTEEFVNRFKERISERRFRTIDPDAVSFAATFPATGTIFIGPPGRTVWVRRHWGIQDDLAPPVEELEDGGIGLYDLFSTDGYDFLGTVRAPDNFELMTGDASRVAGVFTNSLGVESVRVSRFDLVIPQRLTAPSQS